jgi:hypothetical protein
MLQKETVLPELMNVLRMLQNDSIYADYILAGGTALALQLGHRKSDDIDLFTQNSINSEAILNYFNEHYANKYKIVHQEKNILQIANINIILCFKSSIFNGA